MFTIFKEVFFLIFTISICTSKFFIKIITKEINRLDFLYYTDTVINWNGLYIGEVTVNRLIMVMV